MTVVFSDAVESCFRVIAGAAAHVRERVFELQAKDVVRYAQAAGIGKIDIVDRLEAVTAGFEWTPDERQQRIAKAFAVEAQAEPTGIGSIAAAEADRPPTHSDEALALRFADENQDRLRFVSKWGRWQIFNGSKWESDDTLHAFDMVRHVVRVAASEVRKPKAAAAIAAAKTVASVERLAKSDRRIAAAVDQWDMDPQILNTPAGVVDLRSGELRAARPDDYITKITSVVPDKNCPIPVWSAFLHRTTGGSEPLTAFLKRMVGYSLTGSTREHALFFVYGTGANGKSTFLNAVTGCVGGYHRTAPIETFTASAAERHPTDLAGLRGARIVTAVETEEGRRWAESKIKSLTGGDVIAARFMRQDFFEFVPTFKLVIAGNHKPGLRSVDEAIRRRFHLIPFTVTIPPAERDLDLSSKLQAEAAGILAWAIEGCLEWQQHGLVPPAEVQDATAAYLEAEDALAAWIEDSGEPDREAWCSSTALFRSWKTWADRAGEYAGSLKKFSQRLEDRASAIGMVKARGSDGTRGFYGLRLKVPSDVSAPQSEAAE